MQNEQATSTVIVNGEQAKQEMSVLEQRARALKEQLLAANKAGDGKAYDKLSKELKGTQKEMKQLQKESFDVKKVLDNLSGSTMRDLEKAQTKLKAQLRGGEIKRNSIEWKENVRAQKAVRQELRAINAEMQVGEGRMSRFANGFNKYFSSIAAGFAAFAGVVLSLKKFSENRNEREDAQANLEALTGLTVEDIQWLTEEAKIMSTQVSASGVRIRQSSKDIIDAFTLVGSAKPELLNNREALKEVTEQTLILADASKMDLKDAVEGVTMAMNQYSAKADEAARYTNVLAAGSKYGAAAVASITSAVLKSGVSAAQANIPIEALVGTIETLAEKGIKDEIAGTGLKKFFLTLQTGADDTNPKIVGLEQALENMARKQLSATEIKKMFGEEGYNVAAVLLSETERVKYFTDAVTGSGIALEQAGKNSRTLNARLAQSRNKLNEAGMEFVKTLNPAMLKATNLSTQFIKLLVEMPRWLSRNAFTITTLVAIWVAYTVAVNASIIADKLKVFWTDKIIVSLKRLGTAIKSNPWAFAATGVVLLLGWLNKYLNKQQDVNAEIERFITLSEKSKDLNADNKSLEERVKAMKSFSKGQLENLKNDLETQISLLEDYDADIKTQARKLLDTDEEYQKAKKKFSEATNDGQRSVATNQMRRRELDLLEEVSKYYVSNARNLKSLRKNLSDVEELIEKMPDNNPAPPTDPDEEYKIQEAKLERTYKARSFMYVKMLQEMLISQQLYEQLSEESEIEYLESRVALQNKFRKDSLDAEIDLINAKIKIEKNDIKRVEEHRKAVEALKKLPEVLINEEDPIIDITKYTLETRLAIMHKFYEKGLLSEKEYLEELAALYEGNQEKINSALKDGNIKRNKEEYESGTIGRKQYLENIRHISKLYWEEIFADEMDIANKILDVADAATSFVTALAEAETLAVENKYAAQIKAAEKAGHDTTAIEEKMEEEKKSIKKKYADIDFAVTAAKIIAETALAVMEAAPNLPLQIFTGLTGLAQLAVANEQRKSVKNLWTGGFTEPGNKYEPKGVVHAGEFVANQDAVNNQSLRRIFNVIDYAQRTNTVARIDNDTIARALSIKQGFAGGGFTSESMNQITNIVDFTEISGLLTENKTLINLLLVLLNRGIKADVKVSGNGGIKEATDKYEKLIKNATKS